MALGLSVCFGNGQRRRKSRYRSKMDISAQELGTFFRIAVRRGWASFPTNVVKNQWKPCDRFGVATRLANRRSTKAQSNQPALPPVGGLADILRQIAQRSRSRYNRHIGTHRGAGLIAGSR